MAKELTVAVGAALLIAAGCVVAVVAVAGGVEGEPDRLRLGVSLGTPYVVGGMVTLIGLARGVPRHAVAVGAALVPLSMVSVVTLPLLAVALTLLVVGVAATRPGWSIEIPAGLVIAVGLIASMVVLLAFREPVTWRTADGIALAERTSLTGTLVSAAILAGVLGAAMVRAPRTVVPVDPARRVRGPGASRA
jgi:hypothetical protein